MKRLPSLFILIVFCFSSLFNYPVFSAVNTFVPPPGAALPLVALTPAFTPLAIKGLKLYANDPFKFDFMIDEGGLKHNDSQLRAEVQKLINYFLVSLTIPENDLWVNLSPYEKNRVITPELASTNMGEDMLGQDYILKQLAASLTYPEAETGKQYWNEIQNNGIRVGATLAVAHNKRAGASPAPTSEPTQSFNRVWIVPDKAVVYTDIDKAYVGEATLKVMVEEDYLAMQKNSVGANNYSPAVNAFKSHILPALTKEVNEGKNFAQLRQMYKSLILSAWFKKHLKENIINKLYADKKKVNGVDTADPKMRERIYNQYLESCKNGVYNIIKREYAGTGTGSPARGSVYVHGIKITKRAYFSGGLRVGVKPDVRPLTEAPIGAANADVVVSGDMQPADRTPLQKALGVFAMYDRLGIAKSSLAHVNLASAYLGEHKYDEATGHFQEAIKLSPNDQAAHFKLGYALARKKDYSGAIASCKMAISLGLNNPKVYKVMGVAYFNLGQYAEAVESFRKALALDNENARLKALFISASNNLGTALSEQEKYTEAISVYEAAMKIDPDNTLVKKALAVAYFRRGAAYAKRQELPEGIADLEKAISLNPNYFFATLMCGMWYLHQGNYTEAIVKLERALDMQKDEFFAKTNLSDAYSYRGIAYRDQGMLKKAAVDFEMAITVNKENIFARDRLGEIYFMRAVMLIEQGYMTEASDYYGRAVAIDQKYSLEHCTSMIAADPNSHGAYIIRGLAYYCQSRFGKAVEDFEKVLELDSGNVDARDNLSAAYDAWGNFVDTNDDAAAALHFDLAIKFNSENSLALKHRGGVLMRQGGYAQAIEYFDRAININPKYYEAYTSRAIAYFHLSDYIEVAKNLERAIVINPKGDRAYAIYAEVYFRLGKYDKAIKYYNECIARNPFDLVSFRNRAYAYAHNGEYTKAVMDYARAGDIHARRLGIYHETIGHLKLVLEQARHDPLATINGMGIWSMIFSRDDCAQIFKAALGGNSRLAGQVLALPAIWGNTSSGEEIKALLALEIIDINAQAFLDIGGLAQYFSKDTYDMLMRYAMNQLQGGRVGTVTPALVRPDQIIVSPAVDPLNREILAPLTSPEADVVSYAVVPQKVSGKGDVPHLPDIEAIPLADHYESLGSVPQAIQPISLTDAFTREEEGFFETGDALEAAHLAGEDPTALKELRVAGILHGLLVAPQKGLWRVFANRNDLDEAHLRALAAYIGVKSLDADQAIRLIEGHEAFHGFVVWLRRNYKQFKDIGPAREEKLADMLGRIFIFGYSKAVDLELLVFFEDVDHELKTEFSQMLKGGPASAEGFLRNLGIEVDVITASPEELERIKEDAIAAGHYTKEMRTGDRDVGGLNLNSTGSQLEEKGTGIKINQSFAAAAIDPAKFTGFTFRIVGITRLKI